MGVCGFLQESIACNAQRHKKPHSKAKCLVNNPALH